MVATVDIGTLIVRSPEIRGGRSCIAGTGISVRRIVGWYKRGYDAEEIAREIKHLSLGQVYAALTYYYTNREEIEADIAEEEADNIKLEQEWLRSRASQC